MAPDGILLAMRVRDEAQSGEGSKGDLSTQELTQTVYDLLKRRARQIRRGNRNGITLSTTAVVHEAYVRLARLPDSRWSSREHFLAAAARTMRCVLVDYARRRMARKRGGGEAMVPLRESVLLLGSPDVDLVDLDGALTRLEAIDARKVRVVEMLFWCGLSAADAAAALGISESTVHRDWIFARAWLLREMKGERAPRRDVAAENGDRRDP